MFSYAVSLSCLPLVIIILLFCVMMESCFSGSVIKTFRRFSLSVLCTLAFELVTPVCFSKEMEGNVKRKSAFLVFY